MRYLLTIAAVLVSSASFATGWQPEQVLVVAPAGTGEIELSCARVPSSATTLCVYDRWTDSTSRRDLYQITSDNGGVTWSTPVRLTSDSGDEYDAFVAADPSRGRVWVLYSYWGNGNSLGVRNTSNGGVSWSNLTTVISDGGDHWDSSLLVLRNSTLLVFEQLGDWNNGKIRSIQSLDGITWGTPATIYDGPGAETIPVGIQLPGDTIGVVFENSEHDSGSIWIDVVRSYNNGSTWSAPLTLQKGGIHPFIGQQWPGDITVLFAAPSGGWNKSYAMSSDFFGWSAPSVLSTSFSANPEFSVGCRGPIFTYSKDDGSPTGSVVYARRYDWTDTCQ